MARNADAQWETLWFDEKFLRVQEEILLEFQPGGNATGSG